VHAAWLLGAESDTAFHLGQIYEKIQNRPDALRFYARAQASGHRPNDAKRAAAIRFAGGDDPKAALAAAERELSGDHLVRLKTQAPAGAPGGEAEFLVMVGDDAIATDVRFLYGDDAMRALGPALLEPGYPVSSPTRSGLRLVLGVRVKCLGDKGCLGVVAPASRVKLKRENPADAASVTGATAK
jgi:hypothetical protein